MDHGNIQSNYEEVSTETKLNNNIMNVLLCPIYVD